MALRWAIIENHKSYYKKRQIYYISDLKERVTITENSQLANENQKIEKHTAKESFNDHINVFTLFILSYFNSICCAWVGCVGGGGGCCWAIPGCIGPTWPTGPDIIVYIF